MTVINTNVASLRTQAALQSNTLMLQNAMQQLSTGKRINSAADDAAGLAISNRMTSEINGLNQAVRNANDGISMIQTAEGATNTVTSMLQRMRELAVQASNGTYSTNDLKSINTEYGQLYKEIQRVAKTTQWNNLNVLDGTYASGKANMSFFVSDHNVSGASTLAVNIGSFDFSASTGAISGFGALKGLTISTTSGATTLIGKIDTAISGVSTVRSTLGADMNRLQFTVDNLTNISTNLSASRSQIQDVDYAKASSTLAKSQVIQQAATAMLAQANQQPQLVLSLLK
jgi:flagellin